MNLARLLPAIGLAASLAGCVSPGPDGGMALVASDVGEATGQTPVRIADDVQDADAAARARALLRRPLSADAAVQVAFLRNKTLQAAYNDLGISAARYIAASLPPDPTVSILRVSANMTLDIERRLVADILSLATLPARRDIAATRWRQAQLQAVAATLKLGADVRRQYWKAVATRAQANYLASALGGAQTAADLAERLGKTGALNKLDQSREFAFHAELDAQLVKARTQEQVERERLTRLMGLWGEDIRFGLPAALPPLPARLRDFATLEAEALNRRVDLAMARADLEATGKELGLAQATRFVNGFELAAAQNLSKATKVDAAGIASAERSDVRGVEATFRIPVFDFGEARSREANETWMRTVNVVAQTGVNVRSEVREAWLAYRGAHNVARLYQSRVVPLRKAIQDESLLHYNGMLADLFVLLQDARARVLSNVDAINASRDFWLADTDLRSALVGGGMNGPDMNIATTAGAAP